MNGCENITGAVHSFETMGGADGPGIRFVIFLKGCFLRCGYCHNPDTWFGDGEKWTVGDVVKRVLRYKPYFQGGGGVTVSGGEPLMQPGFCAALFKELKDAGISTALDTSGIAPLAPARDVLKNCDLVLCDIKFLTDQEYRRYCKLQNGSVYEFLDLCADFGVPVWVRHVVVPGLTDSVEYLNKLYKKAYSYKNVQKVELLPFKKLCKSKYEQLGIEFEFDKYPQMSSEQINRLTEKIKKQAFNRNC